MNYKTLLRTSQVVFKILSYLNLIFGLVTLFGLIFTIFLSRMFSYMTQLSIGNQEQMNELTQMAAFFHKMRIGFICVPISFLIFFYFFRQLSALAHETWKGNPQTRENISRLKRLSICLVLSYLVDIARVWLLYQTGPMLTGPQGSPSPTTLIESANSILRQHLLFPNFLGASSLVLAFLIFILAKALEEKISLSKEVTRLKEETDLTI